MRVIVANSKPPVRTALRLYLQEQTGVQIVAEVSRVGELLRDAPSLKPDVIFLDWDLPDFRRNNPPVWDQGATPERFLNQTKAIVISSLHHLASNPKVVVTGSQPENRHTIRFLGADAFIDQGEFPGQISSFLQLLQEKNLHP